MRNNRGGSLIEVISTIGLTSLVLTMLAGWLTTTMHSQRVAGKHLLGLNARDRLAQQFRADVHAAQKVMEVETHRLLLAQDESRRVEYLCRNGMVNRVERKDNEVVHQEQYAVGSDDAQIESHAESKPAQIALRLPGSFEIQATLGHDRRFERHTNHEE